MNYVYRCHLCGNEVDPAAVRHIGQGSEAKFKTEQAPQCLSEKHGPSFMATVIVDEDKS